MSDSAKIWRLFRQRGARAAVVMLGSVATFGIIDKLTEGAITSSADYLREKINPSTFVLSYSHPLSPPPAVTISRIETGEAIGVKRVDEDAAIVWAGAGNYRVKLARARDSVRQILPVLVAVKARNEMVAVETDDERWASTAALAKDGDSSYEVTPTPSLLSDTRWVVAPGDQDQARQAATPRGRQIVGAALAEVGVWESGSADDRARIAQYWVRSGLAGFAGTSANSLTLPWGGALLGYVVRKAGAAPPMQAPSFTSWRAWGDPVTRGAEAPGDVLVFSASTLAEARSRLLAGVFLRRRADCLEIIAGNIVDRAVITCVHGNIVAARRAAAS